MKKVYRLEELDCASCAARMEEAIRGIDGVESVSISFMTQKLTIETNEADHLRIMDEAVKRCRRIEPDCEIVR